jgi:hypothetical protein
MAKKDNDNDKDKKVAYFKSPMTFEDFKNMMNDFSLQLFGRPTTLTDDELHSKWEKAQEKMKSAKK